MPQELIGTIEKVAFAIGTRPHGQNPKKYLVLSQIHPVADPMVTVAAGEESLPATG